MHSVCNKFSGLTNFERVFEHVDILIAAEIKLETFFPTAKFLMPGFRKPFRLGVTAKISLCCLYPLENSKPINYYLIFKLCVLK